MTEAQPIPPGWEILWKVCDIIAVECGVSREKVLPSSRLVLDLGIDSLMLVEVILEMEKEFGISIPDDLGRNTFIGQIGTVEDLSRLVVHQWGTGRPSRLGVTKGSEVLYQKVPFTQMESGASLNQEALLVPLGFNRKGFMEYRRRTDGMRCVLLQAVVATVGGAEIALPAFLIDAEPVSHVAFARFLNWVGPVPESFFGAESGDTRIENLGIVSKKGKFVPVSGMETHPVVMVSWFGANAYSLWANGMDWTCEGSMLPTESQWEYAAKGAEEGWTGRHVPGRAYGSQIPTQPVNALIAVSDFGLSHMSGNVWQWCRDWYVAEFNGQLGLEDTGIKSERGGSWVGPAELAVPTYRRGRPPLAKGRCLGFRCVSNPAEIV